ncbi:MAG: P-II family nitrogen regulator [Brevinematia bacterium]
MKKVEAIIRPFKLNDVTSSLVRIGVSGITISEVEGFGQQRGFVETYRGSKYDVRFLPKIKLEIVVKDEIVEDVVKTIIENSKTGEIGDGKIFVYDIDKAYRIRTGESGDKVV